MSRPVPKVAFASKGRVAPSGSETPITIQRLSTDPQRTPNHTPKSPAFSPMDEERFRSLVEEGSTLQGLKDFRGALAKYRQALTYRVQNYGLLAFTYSSAGICAFALGDFDASARFHQSHVDVAQTTNDRAMECQAQCNRGSALAAMGNYPNAIKALSTSRLLATVLGDEQARMRAFGNLGNTYSAMGDFEQAIENHQQQLRVAALLNDPEAEARASHNLQNDHNSLKRYQEAKTFHHAKELVFTAKNDEGVILGNFGTNIAHEDVRAGWVLKHAGSGKKPPTKASTQKRLLVLDNRVLAYFSDAEAKHAQRYIPIDDIHAVEKWGGRTYDSDKNFMVETAVRHFYFTCETAEECSAWIAALSEELPGDARRVQPPSFDDSYQRPNGAAGYETVIFKGISLPGVDEERKFQNPAYQEEPADEEFSSAVNGLKVHSEKLSTFQKRPSSATQWSQEPTYDKARASTATASAVTTASATPGSHTLAVQPLGQYHIDAEDDEPRPTATVIRQGYHGLIAGMYGDLPDSQEFTFDDDFVILKKIQSAKGFRLPVAEFNIADLCAVESFDTSLVFVLKAPKFTAHAFACTSAEEAKSTRNALRDKIKQLRSASAQPSRGASRGGSPGNASATSSRPTSTTTPARPTSNTTPRPAPSNSVTPPGSNSASRPPPPKLKTPNTTKLPRKTSGQLPAITEEQAVAGPPRETYQTLGRPKSKASTLASPARNSAISPDAVKPKMVHVQAAPRRPVDSEPVFEFSAFDDEDEDNLPAPASRNMYQAPAVSSIQPYELASPGTKNNGSNLYYEHASPSAVNERAAPGTSNGVGKPHYEHASPSAYEQNDFRSHSPERAEPSRNYEETTHFGAPSYEMADPSANYEQNAIDARGHNHVPGAQTNGLAHGSPRSTYNQLSPLGRTNQQPLVSADMDMW